MVNHHPHDGRIGLDSGGVVQTLTARMGTGGGNVPLILDRPVFAVNSVHTDRKPGGMFGKPAAVAKTLDLRGGDPGCNQGGMIILDQADIYSASKTDYFVRASTNQAGALVASDYKASPIRSWEPPTLGHANSPQQSAPASKVSQTIGVTTWQSLPQAMNSCSGG